MRLATLGILCATLACGGGGAESVMSGGDGSVIATFIPTGGSPQPQTLAMALGGASGDTVTVAFNLVDMSGVYGAAFQVTYDPAHVTYEGYAPGTVLETGGHQPTYQVDSAGAGMVYVAASRNGNVPGVDVNGTKTLIRLMFRVTDAGSTPLGFGDPALYDAGLPPLSIQNVIWVAGELVAE